MKKTKKKIKLTKKQIDIVNSKWRKLKTLEALFYRCVAILEKEMEKDTGVKGIEFVTDGGGYLGVGDISRTMDLIQGEDIK